jgi:hypothetical protein
MQLVPRYRLCAAAAAAIRQLHDHLALCMAPAASYAYANSSTVVRCAESQRQQSGGDRGAAPCCMAACDDLLSINKCAASHGRLAGAPLPGTALATCALRCPADVMRKRLAMHLATRSSCWRRLCTTSATPLNLAAACKRCSCTIWQPGSRRAQASGITAPVMPCTVGGIGACCKHVQHSHSGQRGAWTTAPQYRQTMHTRHMVRPPSSSPSRHLCDTPLASRKHAVLQQIPWLLGGGWGAGAWWWWWWWWCGGGKGEGRGAQQCIHAVHHASAVGGSGGAP